MRPQWIRLGFTALAAVLGLTLTASPAAASGSHSNRQQCQTVSLDVKLTPTDTTPYKLAAELCARGQLKGKTVQVLLSGFTYGPEYWDFSYKPWQYSYVRAATAAGYATLNVTRPGIAPNERVAADRITIPSEAYVASQIVQQLRNGQIKRVHAAFTRVVGVGHSMGGGIWMVSAANYAKPASPDALIINGFLHSVNPATVTVLTGARHAAKDDPQFPGAPDGYLTTVPGKRNVFYAPQYAEPKVIQADENTKQTATIGEATTLAGARDPAHSAKITVPVFMTTGRYDSLGCDDATPTLSCANSQAILDREKPLWPNACLDAYVQPLSGHDSNLHISAPLWFWAANRWIDNLDSRSRPAACRA